MSILIELVLRDTANWDGTTVVDLTDDPTTQVGPIVIVAPQHFRLILTGPSGVLYMADLVALLNRRLPIQQNTGTTKTPVKSLEFAKARNATEENDVWIERILVSGGAGVVITAEPGLHSPATQSTPAGVRLVQNGPPNIVVVNPNSLMFGATGVLDDVLPATNSQGPLYIPNGYALYLETTAGAPTTLSTFLTLHLEQDRTWGTQFY